MRLARFVRFAAPVALLLQIAPVAHAQTVQSTPGVQADHASSHDSGSDRGLVRAVREATIRFLDVRAAVAAGYAPFLGCVSGTQEGAMGVHYVDGALVADGKVNADYPEALLYEMRNGRLFLLGVEFIVDAATWDAGNAQPPVLLGQVFTYNSSPNRFGLAPFYALHVWAWKDNPHGTFVDWNPQVSCDGFTVKK